MMPKNLCFKLQVRVDYAVSEGVCGIDEVFWAVMGDKTALRFLTKF
jgi:hypothetical protein